MMKKFLDQRKYCSIAEAPLIQRQICAQIANNIYHLVSTLFKWPVKTIPNFGQQLWGSKVQTFQAKIETV